MNKPNNVTTWPITLKMRFEKSRLLDVSPEVQNISHLFHTAIWCQKKVVPSKIKWQWTKLSVVKFAPKSHVRSKMIMGKRFAYPHHCLRPMIIRKGKELKAPDNLADPMFVVSLFLGATPVHRVLFCSQLPPVQNALAGSYVDTYNRNTHSSFGQANAITVRCWPGIEFTPCISV